jgi:hypothetical protein
VERAEGYVKTLEKATFPVLSLREVVEHSTDNYLASGKRLKVILKVLSFV